MNIAGINADVPRDWNNEEFEVEDEQFLNQHLVQNYLCCFCLSVAKTPWVHMQPGCHAIFCAPCLHEFFRIQPNSTCPLKCTPGDFQQTMGDSVGPLEAGNGVGCPSLEEFETLQLVCKFCPSILRYSEYRAHINVCEVNPNNGPCPSCNVPRRDVMGYRHSCRTYISELRGELQRAQRQVTIQRERIIELRSRVENRVLVGQAIPGPVTGHRGYVQNIRTALPYRDAPSIIIHHQGTTTRFDNVNPESTGLTIRQQLEARLGHTVGSIIRCDYTVLQDSRRIRQHQVGHRPTYWIALPDGVNITDGQLLDAELLDFGPVL